MARPRIYEEERIATAMRLPASLHRQLQEAAQERDVSVNLLMVRALESYLRRLQPLDGLVADEEIRPAS